MTDDRIVELFELKFKHIEGKLDTISKNVNGRLDKIDEKIEKIDTAIYKNNGQGMRTVIALNSEYVEQAKEADLIAQVAQNSAFRIDVKKLFFKIIIAAVLSSGATSGIIQGLSKLFG